MSNFNENELNNDITNDTTESLTTDNTHVNPSIVEDVWDKNEQTTPNDTDVIPVDTMHEINEYSDDDSTTTADSEKNVTVENNQHSNNITPIGNNQKNTDETNDTPANPNQTVMKKSKESHPFLIGFIGGICGTLLLGGGYLLVNQSILSKSPSHFVSTSSNTKAATLSSNLEDSQVGNAVANAQEAVVSVLNYQTTTASLFGYSRESSSSLQKVGEGSGVIYKVDNGYAYIVTNHHVIDKAKELEILLHDGANIKAELVGQDTLTDLAVLRIKSEHVTKIATFTNSDEVKVGQTVLAIGSPLGSELANSVTKGIVSATNRSITVDTNNDKVEDWSTQTIQTDAAINPGNSGGALIDLNGNVIGINSMKISNTAVEGIGFAIPSNDVVSIINELEQKGAVSRPVLGVNLLDLSEISTTQKQQLLKLNNDVSDGVVITGIQNNSSADKSGLQQYDVIVSWNNQPITSTIALRKQLYSSKIGDKITLEIYRNGTKQQITLTLIDAKGL